MAIPCMSVSHTLGMVRTSLLRFCWLSCVDRVNAVFVFGVLMDCLYIILIPSLFDELLAGKIDGGYYYAVDLWSH